MTPEERKQKSITLLKEQGVPVFEMLPKLEDSSDITPRTEEEIARRAAACLIAIQVACDYMQDANIQESVEIMANFADNFGVKNDLTPKEQLFFTGTPSKQDALNMTWKYEACWTLFWALGLIEELDYPDHVCDCPKAISFISENENIDALLEKTNLRTIDEILDQADLIFRYDWACVDARVNNRPTPAGLDNGVVHERHWGLNWLIGKNGYNNDWDNVSCDT